MKPLLAREEGFTLIETLVAVAIFAVGSLGVLGLVTTAITLNGQTRQFMEAGLVGQWKLDILSTKPFTDANISGCSTSTPITSMCRANGTAIVAGSTQAVVDLSALGATTSSGVNYQLFWSATDLTGAGYSGMKAIAVDVYWPHARDAQAIAPLATGFIDCGASPGDCYALHFHSFRKL